MVWADPPVIAKNHMFTFFWDPSLIWVSGSPEPPIAILPKAGVIFSKASLKLDEPLKSQFFI